MPSVEAPSTSNTLDLDALKERTPTMRGGNASHIVMKQVGHKTDSMLRRYQLIDERDLLELQINPLVTTQDQKTG